MLLYGGLAEELHVTRHPIQDIAAVKRLARFDFARHPASCSRRSSEGCSLDPPGSTKSFRRVARRLRTACRPERRGRGLAARRRLIEDRPAVIRNLSPLAEIPA